MQVNPILAEVAAVLRDAGDWGWVVDRDWRLVSRAACSSSMETV